MNTSETNNNKEGAIPTSNQISREIIIWFMITVVCVSTALLQPEIYTAPLDLFLLSTKLIGFHIIQFCQAHSALLVGGLATGLGVYAFNRLLNR